MTARNSAWRPVTVASLQYQWLGSNIRDCRLVQENSMLTILQIKILKKEYIDLRQK